MNKIIIIMLLCFLRRQKRFENQGNTPDDWLLHTSGQWNVTKFYGTRSHFEWHSRADNPVHLSNLSCHVGGKLEKISFRFHSKFLSFYTILQSPPRGATIPYRPKPQVSGPVILANGQAFTIQGNYAVPAQEVNCH